MPEVWMLPIAPTNPRQELWEMLSTLREKSLAGNLVEGILHVHL
jgi:hypothetical protein